VFRALESVTLKTGEVVEAGVVVGPDLDWADRLADLLSHKGSTWQYGNEMALRHDIGIDALFYVLHRDGEPFVNMMNIEYRGVGLFGHVYTRPEDREQGAASGLMPQVMADFRRRDGRALYLGTGYDGHPYRMYAKNGFAGFEPRSGYMGYYTNSEEHFYKAYFEGTAVIEKLDWPNWPASIPLFAGNFPGTVRSIVMGATGRYSTEGPMIPLQRDETQRPEMGLGTRTAILKIPETGAVAGLATYGANPLWRGSWTVDLYCHPNYWEQGDDLLAAVEIQPAERLLAYCDAGFEPKERILKRAGFEPVVTYRKRVAADYARTRHVDVTEWQKTSL